MFFCVLIGVLQSSNTPFERTYIEIHHEPGGESTQFEIGDYLRLVDGMEAFDCFQLHDYHIFDNEIESKVAADCCSLVVKCDAPLVFNAKPCAFQFEAKTLSVYRLE